MHLHRSSGLLNAWSSISLRFKVCIIRIDRELFNRLISELVTFHTGLSNNTTDLTYKISEFDTSGREGDDGSAILAGPDPENL